MNFEHSCGESSNKRQENGDKMSDNDRPLKKARFAWQVKGKYHLKEQDVNVINESIKLKNDVLINESDDDDASLKDSSSDESKTDNEIAASAEQNLEILGDYLLKQDFNTVVDTVVNDFPIALTGVDTSSNVNNLPYPRYVPSSDNIESLIPSNRFVTPTNGNTNGNNNRLRDINIGNVNIVPVSMVGQNSSSTEDLYLARWQARQMAKGFVDNTINRVLDSWLMAPLPVSFENNRHLALDVAEFLDNLPGGNRIENEGILMAISAHGLQNNAANIRVSNAFTEADFKGTSSSTSNENVNNSDVKSTVKDNDTVKCCKSGCTKTNVDSLSKDPFEDGAEPPAWRGLDQACSCSHSIRSSMVNNNLIPQIPFHKRKHYIPETQTSMSSSSRNKTASKVPTPKVETAGTSRSGPNTPNDNNTDSVFGNHFDFIDAAVSFAIQNKGLTSFGNDYG